MNLDLQKIGACIFDLDGVVVDTFDYHYRAWQRLANQFGFDFTESHHHQLAGMSRMACLEQILEWSGVYATEAEKLYYSEVKNSWYVDLIAEMKPEAALPGVRGFLSGLRELEIKTALVSSSRNARAVLKSTGLSAFFDCVIAGADIKRPKPHPERYLMAAHTLNACAQSCLIFEDTALGVMAGHAGGFKVVGVGLPFPKNADVCVESFESKSAIDLLSQLRSQLQSAPVK